MVENTNSQFDLPVTIKANATTTAKALVVEVFKVALTSFSPRIELHNIKIIKITLNSTGAIYSAQFEQELAWLGNFEIFKFFTISSSISSYA